MRPIEARLCAADERVQLAIVQHPTGFRIAAKHPELVTKFEGLMLERFRATHPEADREPGSAGRGDAIEFYLRPRDAKPKG